MFCVHSIKQMIEARMRNFINRLDAICHPFPGTHVLGLISSIFLRRRWFFGRPLVRLGISPTRQCQYQRLPKQPRPINTSLHRNHLSFGLNGCRPAARFHDYSVARNSNHTITRSNASRKRQSPHLEAQCWPNN